MPNATPAPDARTVAPNNPSGCGLGGGGKVSRAEGRKRGGAPRRPCGSSATKQRTDRILQIKAIGWGRCGLMLPMLERFPHRSIASKGACCV